MENSNQKNAAQKPQTDRTNQPSKTVPGAATDKKDVKGTAIPGQKNQSDQKRK